MRGSLTDRDEKIVRTIGAFGLLSTRQLKKLLFGGVRKTTMHRRLRILESRKVLRRVTGFANGSVAWCLSKQTAESFGFESTPGHINRNTLEHDTLLSEVRMALARAGIGGDWLTEYELRRKAWRTKYRRESDRNTIPDALITLDIGGTFRVIALELELKRKSKQRYKDLLRNYYFTKSIWRIWYVVANATLGCVLEREWRELTGVYAPEGFMWCTLSDLLRDPKQTKVSMGGKEHLLTQVLTP